MTFAEVEKVLLDAWRANMASGVTQTRKNYWRAWVHGYIYALHTTNQLSFDEEKKAIDYINKDI